MLEIALRKIPTTFRTAPLAQISVCVSIKPMSLSTIVALLQAALVLLTLAQSHPELPQSVRDNATQVARQAITQATVALSSQPSGLIELPSTATPTITTAPAGSKTYTNNQYGFSFDYPIDLQLQSDSANLTNFGDSETGLAAIRLMGGNNVGDGEWRLTTSSYPDNVAHCLDSGTTPDIAYSDLTTVTINGVPFTAQSYSSTLSGYFEHGKFYKAIHLNTCYIILIDIRSGRDGRIDASKISSAEADWDQIIAKLDPIILTFHFR